MAPLVAYGSRALTARNGQVSAPPCILAAHELQWIQDALDAWEQASREFLHLDPLPLPWMVLFDDACTWHLAPHEGELTDAAPVQTPLTVAGTPVPVHALPHDGTVHLPNGSTMPVGLVAAASSYDNGRTAFFVLALLDLWHQHPQASQDPHLEERLLGVVTHEIIHTRQLPQVKQRVDTLRARYSLDIQVDDNVVENRFHKVPGFRKAFEAERDVFYDAVFAPTAARQKELVDQGLAMARARRARFFTGPDAPYAVLETLFLNMEGVAEWVRFKIHQTAPNQPRSDADIVAFLRGTNNDWVQDEGLALFLLLEELRPGWQSKVLGPALASPFELLERAVAR